MARLVNRESINLQSKKIREVAEALIAAGYLCLDDQATALGLPRSTTWTILHANHKNSGLSASVIKQMLAEPRLPEVVRAKILEYVGQKSSGAYGHNPQRVRRFVSGLVGVLTIADDQNGAFANYRDGPRLANCSGSFASSSGVRGNHVAGLVCDDVACVEARNGAPYIEWRQLRVRPRYAALTLDA